MKTLEQLIQETSQNEVFGDIMDQATEDDLAFYFATYEVYGENFVHFLQRKLKLLKPQYDKYLTIEATQFSPLVTEYMKIVHDNTINSTHENDTKHTGYDDIVFGHKNTQGGTDSTSYGKSTTRTGSENHDTDFKTVKTGSEEHDTDFQTVKTGSESHDSDFSTTRTGSESHDTDFSIEYSGSERTTDNTSIEYQGSETTSASGDSASLAAATPPTAPNNLTSFRQSGFQSGVGTEQMSDTNSESTLSFTNRKDQHDGYTEKSFTNRSDTQSGGDTVTYNSVKDQHDGGDEITYNSITDAQSGGDTVTYNNVTDTQSGGDTVTFNNVKDTLSGTDTLTHGRTDTESGTNTNNFNSNVNDKGEHERKEDLKEEREGYKGIPAELLGRARNYILDTNAFRWLTTELLTCFMDIMEY